MGAGGIAGNLAGHLALAGEDITIVDAWPAHIDAIVAAGLRLRGGGGEQLAHPRALHVGEAWQLRDVDVLILGVKAYDNEWCTALLKPCLKRDATVLSAQNGVQEERLAEIFGAERVVGAVVLFAGALDGPGCVRLETPGREQPATAPAERGRLLIGELHGRTTPRLLALQALLEHAVAVPISDNIWGELWSKLVMNCMSNPINAVLGGASADARLEPGPRAVSLRVGAEAAALGQKLGYEIPAIAGIAADALVAAGGGQGVEAVARQWAATGQALKGIVGSMPRDMRRGHKTEADSFCGYIVRKAFEVGLPVPANESVDRLVRAIEAGELRPGPENLGLLVGLGDG